MAAGSEQASKHTRARAQCSNASVGLAQARPNNFFVHSTHMGTFETPYYGFPHTLLAVLNRHEQYTLDIQAL